MRPNIPTMLQADWFETSHADLLLAAVIGEAPKPKSKLRHIDYVGALRMAEYNDIPAMVKQLLLTNFDFGTQPQPEGAELCPICLITPLVGSDCPRCGDD